MRLWECYCTDYDKQSTFEVVVAANTPGEAIKAAQGHWMGVFHIDEDAPVKSACWDGLIKDASRWYASALDTVTPGYTIHLKKVRPGPRMRTVLFALPGGVTAEIQLPHRNDNPAKVVIDGSPLMLDKARARDVCRVFDILGWVRLKDYEVVKEEDA